jgi:parvulin-like peptidyl-prolyl isomerase
MAKKDRKSTPLGKVGRVERERRYNRFITFGTILVVGTVVVVIIAGTILEGFVHPNQPVAIVAGEEILTREFQARVTFRRAQLVNEYYNYFQLKQMLTDPSSQAQIQSRMNLIQFQLDPYTFGQSTINGMIDEIIIKQTAQAREIKVTEEEIDELLEALFNYFQDGVPTPTETPTTAPTSTFSATQLALVTLTPTPTTTPTATLDPVAELEVDTDGTPTATVVGVTPTPEPYTFDNYQEDLQSFFEFQNREYKVTEEDIRAVFEAQLYRQKLLEVITADLPHEQDMVWARHILVEDEQTAMDVLNKIENGEDWVELAVEYSLDTTNAERGGDLGWFNLTAMIPEFARVAFNTQLGAISDPIQTNFGWHIIQVLGHEMRPLTPQEYSSYQQEEFNLWLGQMRLTYEFELMDYWENRIPDEPALPQIPSQ